MNKRLIKIVSIVLVVLAIFALISFVNATGTKGSGYSANDYAPNVQSDFANKGRSVGGVVIGVVKVASVLVAVGMLMFVGWKYVTSGADGQAKIKEQLGVYVLGAVLLFSVLPVINMIQGFTTKSLNGTGSGNSQTQTQSNG